MNAGGKYRPVAELLERAGAAGEVAVEFSFDELDALVPGGLPDSARRLRQWWANDSKTQARTWRRAGWHVAAVSVERGHVRFEPGEVGGTYLPRIEQRRR